MRVISADPAMTNQRPFLMLVTAGNLVTGCALIGSPRARRPGSRWVLVAVRCSPTPRTQPHTRFRGPGGTSPQREAGVPLVPTRSPAVTAMLALGAYLVGIRWSPLEREVAGDQRSRRWTRHGEGGPWSEADPAACQDRAIGTQLTPVSVVITE